MKQSVHTLAELAQEAIDIQNACNILGLTKSFAESAQELYTILNRPSFNEYNKHPILKLWTYKLHNITSDGASDEYNDAYEECKQLARHNLPSHED